jgi:hypothetical protein
MDNITLNTLSRDPCILHIMFRGTWTWNDLDTLIERNSLSEEVAQTPLYVVADFTESAQLPPSILVKVYSILSRAPTNLQQTVVVSNNSFVEGIVATFKHVFNKYQRALAIVGSRDEAVSLIMSYKAGDMN